jgi:hypothetical protein
MEMTALTLALIAIAISTMALGMAVYSLSTHQN